ncbi:MAG: alanine racemase [Puniceicoccales bacterium]|jgi:alanine racemase|nr:alanine racemase [Puniceicoccales bacterium]
MSPAPPPFARRAWVEIDLSALERNLGKIKAHIPPRIHYIAIVKADAYGHGLAPIVTRLLQCGVENFAVANVREGADVREIGPGANILVLGPILPEEIPRLADYQLTATLSTPEEARALATHAAARRHRQPVHIKIDTGMGRMGAWHTTAPQLIRDIHQQHAGTLDIRGICTHFPSADTDPRQTTRQRHLFQQVLDTLPRELNADARLLIHADNSAGLDTLPPNGPFNAIRIGLLQYGLTPNPGSPLAHINPEPVLSFHSRVGLIKTLPPGATLSYNRTHTLAHTTRIAIITAGYGDGIPLSASNRAQVLIHGQRCRILGRVTMDQTLVDITANPDATAGDTATLIGTQPGGEITLREFCSWTDTIPWEVFCSITKRVERAPRGLRIQ